MTVKWNAVFTALAALGLLAAGIDRGEAAGTAAAITGASIEVSSQARARPRRVPRIEVFPRRYYYNPGPDAVRECRAWYAQEFRPSGTVVVPRMRCWWQRGY